jgi:hypothetical protein
MNIVVCCLVGPCVMSGLQVSFVCLVSVCCLIIYAMLFRPCVMLSVMSFSNMCDMWLYTLGSFDKSRNSFGRVVFLTIRNRENVV